MSKEYPKLHFLERFGDSDHQAMAEEIFSLRDELKWAYRYIIGDTEDTQEMAGWRCFNGLKRLEV